jgi:hypothetical protein
MAQELESLHNLVGLLLWQREEAEAADLGSEASTNGIGGCVDGGVACGLTSQPPSASGTPRDVSLGATPRGGLPGRTGLSVQDLITRVTSGQADVLW